MHRCCKASVGHKKCMAATFLYLQYFTTSNFSSEEKKTQNFLAKRHLHAQFQLCMFRLQILLARQRCRSLRPHPVRKLSCTDVLVLLLVLPLLFIGYSMLIVFECPQFVCSSWFEDQNSPCDVLYFHRASFNKCRPQPAKTGMRILQKVYIRVVYIL